MIAYILTALIFILLIWVLFGPVMLLIDTEKKRYLFTLPGVLSARVISREDLFYIRMWIFFLPFKIDPFKVGRRPSSSSEITGKEKKSRSRRISPVRFMQKAGQAIRIRRLDLDLDTDDFPLNARLVPVFSALSGRNRDLRVNFEGKMYLHLDLRTRIAALLWMYFSK